MNTDTLVGAWFYDGMIAVGSLSFTAMGGECLRKIGVCFWLEGWVRE
jgi:hypothetical protein